ncbi:MAG: DEAD/DEAH box helicase [Acidimicrobiia bacterium]|nr:DEAD/DEAH box helicase [Acidimicrobiia bacterium]MDJ0665340.1 DEAD/DEAH box helicase [Acidimicrobiia bacterium]
MPTTPTFRELGVADDLANALVSDGIGEPFPIQQLTIPDALEGRDVCGKAKTGSGKTLAFGLPIIQQLERAPVKRPLALVLVPTRELAQQVTAVLEPLAALRDFRTVAVYGGAPMGVQIKALRRGVEVVIATPGRLIDLIDRRELQLDEVRMVAIDEADQMADMGFLPQVRRIMSGISVEHQTFLFSATLDGQVGTLVSAYMEQPARHDAEPDGETVDTMEHRFLKVHHMDKVKMAAAIADSSGRTLVFVRTKIECDRVAKNLREAGVEARAIHGDLHQRQRDRALAGFADGTSPVLVATNVAARGLHIDDVDVVIHYDPPDDPKTYLHRSGRTARAGETGLVVTFVEWDQVNEVLGIQRRAGLNVPIIKMFSNDDRIRDLSSWRPDPELAPFKGRRSHPMSRGRRRR